MLIGRLAKESGFSRDTIRYYEKLGLIQAGKIDRHPNNYKNYPARTVQRLNRISALKEAGFTLAEIQPMLEDFDHPGSACAGLPARLIDKAAQIEAKILALQGCRSMLFEIMKSCNGKCDCEGGLPACMSSR